MIVLFSKNALASILIQHSASPHPLLRMSHALFHVKHEQGNALTYTYSNWD